MKAIIGTPTRMFLILLTLMNITGCFGRLPDSGNSSDGYANNSAASGYVIVATGQIVCYEDSGEHVTCTCYR